VTWYVMYTGRINKQHPNYWKKRSLKAEKPAKSDTEYKDMK